MTRPWRPRPRTILILAAGLITVASAYLAVRDAHPAETWDAAADANLVWLLPCLVLLVFAFFVRALRWWSLFDAGPRPRFRAVASALYLGYLANAVLPVRAGEVARAAALTRAEAIPVARIVGAMMIERAYDVLSLLVLLFLMAPWLPHVDWLQSAALLAAALVVALAVGMAVLVRYRERAFRPLLRPLGWLPFIPAQSVARAPTELFGGLAGLLRVRTAGVAFAWTTFSWIVLGIAYWLAMKAFDIALSPLAGLLVVIGIGLALILPSSPAALGVFEAATVAVLRAYGVDASTALSYALVLHLVNVVPLLIIAPLFVSRRSRATSPPVARSG